MNSGNNEPNQVPKNGLVGKALKPIKNIIYVLVGLYISYVLIFSNPMLDETAKVLIFGSMLGAMGIVVYIIFVMEYTKKKKESLQ